MSLGDVYVDVHANTDPARREVARDAKTYDKEGRIAGKQFSKGMSRETNKGLKDFKSNFSNEINRAVRSIKPVDLKINDGYAHRQLYNLRRQLTGLSKGTIAGVSVDDKAALLELKKLRAELALLSRNTDLKIRVQAQGALGAVTEAIAASEAMNAVVNEAGPIQAAAKKTSGGLGLIMVGLGALIAMAGPAAAALGGIAIALAAPIGIGVAGGGLFAFLAGKYVKDTLKQAKANKTLTDSQKEFIKQKDAFGKSLKDFTKTNGDALIAPVTDAMKILERLMPKVTPLVQGFSDAFVGLLDELNKSGALDRFIAVTAKEGPKALTTMGHLVGNLSSALGTLFHAGLPLGQKALTGISNAFGRFSQYLKSAAGQQQLQQFFQWVETNGPIVGHAVVEISKAIYDLFKFIGPDALKAIEVLGEVAHALDLVIKALPQANGLMLPFIASLVLVALKGRAASKALQEVAAANGAAAASGAAANAGGGVGFWTGKGKMLLKAGVFTVLIAGLYGIAKGLDEVFKKRDFSNLTSTLDQFGRTTKDTTSGIKKEILSTDFGKWAKDAGININQLAKGLETSGTKSAEFKAAFDQLTQTVPAHIGGVWAEEFQKIGKAADQFVAANKKRIALQKSQIVSLIDTETMLGNISPKIAAGLKALPPEVATTILINGADTTLTQVATLVNQYGLLKNTKAINTILSVTDNTGITLDSIKTEIANLQKSGTIPVTLDNSKIPEGTALAQQLLTAHDLIFSTAPDPDTAQKAYNSLVQQFGKLPKITVALNFLTAGTGGGNKPLTLADGLSSLLTNATRAARSQGIKVPVTPAFANGSIQTLTSQITKPQTMPVTVDPKNTVKDLIAAVTKSQTMSVSVKYHVVGTVPTGVRTGQTTVNKPAQGPPYTGARLLPGFARGGKVPGQTPSDKTFDNVQAISRRGNPIRVQSGEWIINSRSSKQNNRLLAAINNGFNAQRAMGLGYASGGSLGSIAGFGAAVRKGDQDAMLSAINNLISALKTAGETQGLAFARQTSLAMRPFIVALGKNTEQIKTFNDKVQSVRDQVTSGANIFTSTGTKTDFASILKLQQQNAQKSIDFATALKDLRGAGLNNTMIQQLANAGPGALKQAASIFRSGPGGILALNALQKQIESAGTRAGKEAGASLLGASPKETAQGFLQGLTNQKAQLQKQLISFGEYLGAGVIAKLDPKKKTKHSDLGILGTPVGGVKSRTPAKTTPITSQTTNHITQVFNGPMTGSLKNKELDWTLRYGSSTSSASGATGHVIGVNR